MAFDWWANPFLFSQLSSNFEKEDGTKDARTFEMPLETFFDRSFPNKSFDFNFEEPNDTTQTFAPPRETSQSENYDEVYFPAIGALLVIGVTGNLFVIVQTIRDKLLHTPTFAVIASLACADLMFLMIRIPMEFAFQYIDDWIFGDVPCRLYMYFVQVVAYAESYHLVLLAVVRYYQLTHPLNAHICLSTKRALHLSTGLWVFLIVVLSPILAYTGVVRYYRGPNDTTGFNFCYLQTNSLTKQKAYFLCYSVLCFLLPLFILIIFHVGKAIRIRHVSVFAKNNKKLKVMSAAVVCILVLFGVLLAPVHINNILLITNTVTFHPLLDVIIKLMAYLNSVINPFVYAFCAQKVRESFFNCLPCYRTKR